MKDPFPIPPPAWLMEATQPLAHKLSLPTLPLHIHEVLFAFVLYTTIGSIISPIVSPIICPRSYPALNKRSKLSFDVHVVSFFQAVLISGLSLYVIFYDEERKELRPRDRWESRVGEYTGMSGLCQSFALGYFLWDFIMCSVYIEIFGVGMLAHAISALSVFALGYRPFLYFYAPVFLLYELSSPFLNIHWFCDKLGMTGSSTQAINGVFLVSSFFGCRLIWGNMSSVYVFMDIFRCIFSRNAQFPRHDIGAPINYSTLDLLSIYADEQGQRLAFAGRHAVPLWLGLVYLSSNLVLNSLNVYWFGKMIETIRTRFDPPFGTKGVGEEKAHAKPTEPKEKILAEVADALENTDAHSAAGASPKGSVKAARERAEAALDSVDVSRSVDVGSQRTLRTRRKA